MARKTFSRDLGTTVLPLMVEQVIACISSRTITYIELWYAAYGALIYFITPYFIVHINIALHVIVDSLSLAFDFYSHSKHSIQWIQEMCSSINSKVHKK